MDTRIIDLHVHSCCSDGTFSPSELVKYASQKGLSAFALTDHDTFNGVKEAQAAAAKTSVEVISGIEFSTVYCGCDVHVVGIDLDVDHPKLQSHMENFIRSRDLRNQQIAEKMASEGFDISIEKLRASFGDTILTRAHFARYLFDRHYTSSLKEAFDLYLAEGKPYHIPREKITPQEVVHLIYETGGIPILAHPMLYHLAEEQLNSLILDLKQEGLIGIEALYSTYSTQEEFFVKELAQKYSLALSGGSDFHGSNKPGLDLGNGYGNLRITYDILEKLRSIRSI